MRKDILIFAVLTVGTILILVFTGPSVIDVQLHDTYIVLDEIWVAILIIGPLTFLIYLSLGLVRKFNTTSSNIGLIVGLCLISLIIFKVARFQSTYRDQIQNNSALHLQAKHKERFLTDMDKKIALTWGLFTVCIIGIGWASYRTYKLMTVEHDN